MPGWNKEDEAARLEREADIAQVTVDQGLQAALRIDPELPEAHAALAERYLTRHKLAERRATRPPQRSSSPGSGSTPTPCPGTMAPERPARPG